MAWFPTEPKSQAHLAQRLRDLLQEGKILVLPGVPDALAARIALKVGFQALSLIHISEPTRH